MTNLPEGYSMQAVRVDNPSMNATQLIDALANAPESLQHALVAAHVAAEDAETAVLLYKRAEARIAGEVASAKGDDGKPLYTNDMTRKAALEARLFMEAGGLDAQVVARKRDAAQANIHLEVTRARLRVYGDIARVLGGNQ